jgi:hypothetical protein
MGLVRLLCRHLGVAADDDADDDVHRLAFSIVGLAIALMISTDPIQALRPSLMANAQAIDTYSERMADYAMAMFQAEKLRRSAPPAPK